MTRYSYIQYIYIYNIYIYDQFCHFADDDETHFICPCFEVLEPLQANNAEVDEMDPDGQIKCFGLPENSAAGISNEGP